MITGKTTSGFEWEVKETVMEDMEVLDLYADVEDGKPYAGRLIRKVLGVDQAKKLYDHVRLEDGTVPVEPLMNEFMEIMNSEPETKN